MRRDDSAEGSSSIREGGRLCAMLGFSVARNSGGNLVMGGNVGHNRTGGEPVDGGEILGKMELFFSINGKIVVEMNLLGVLWETVVDEGIIVFIGQGR